MPSEDYIFCIFLKYNGGNDEMVLFGDRDNNNVSLKDLNILHKMKMIQIIHINIYGIQ